MGYSRNTPKGYYIGIQNRKADKYDGLLSPRQLRDLEGETELVSKSVSTKELHRKIKESKGTSMNMHTPMDKPR